MLYEDVMCTVSVTLATMYFGEESVIEEEVTMFCLAGGLVCRAGEVLGRGVAAGCLLVVLFVCTLTYIFIHITMHS